MCSRLSSHRRRCRLEGPRSTSTRPEHVAPRARAVGYRRPLRRPREVAAVIHIVGNSPRILPSVRAVGMRGDVDRGGSRSSEDVATWHLGRGPFGGRMGHTFEFGVRIARIFSRRSLRMEGPQGLGDETARRPPKPATRFRHARDTKRRQTTISPAKRNHGADLGRCTISKEVDKRRKRPGIGLLIRRFRVRFPGDPRSTWSDAIS